MHTNSRTLEDNIANREAKLDALHTKLTNAVEELVTGEDWRAAMEFAARFRARSAGNDGIVEVAEWVLPMSIGGLVGPVAAGSADGSCGCAVAYAKDLGQDGWGELSGELVCRGDSHPARVDADPLQPAREAGRFQRRAGVRTGEQPGVGQVFCGSVAPSGRQVLDEGGQWFGQVHWMMAEPQMHLLLGDLDVGGGHRHAADGLAVDDNERAGDPVGRVDGVVGEQLLRDAPAFLTVDRGGRWSNHPGWEALLH